MANVVDRSNPVKRECQHASCDRVFSRLDVGHLALVLSLLLVIGCAPVQQPRLQPLHNISTEPVPQRPPRIDSWAIPLEIILSAQTERSLAHLRDWQVNEALPGNEWRYDPANFVVPLANVLERNFVTVAVRDPATRQHNPRDVQVAVLDLYVSDIQGSVGGSFRTEVSLIFLDAAGNPSGTLTYANDARRSSNLNDPYIARSGSELAAGLDRLLRNLLR